SICVVNISAQKTTSKNLSVTIWKKGFENLPFWDSSINHFSDAYIDTFSEDGCKFRIVSPVESYATGGNSVRLQNLLNNQWTYIGVELKNNIYGSNYDYSVDINNDGFNDITNYLRFSQDVYFFNPTTKNFIAIDPEAISYDWTLIDTAKNIYCDFNEEKRMS